MRKAGAVAALARGLKKVRRAGPDHPPACGRIGVVAGAATATVGGRRAGTRLQQKHQHQHQQRPLLHRKDVSAGAHSVVIHFKFAATSGTTKGPGCCRTLSVARRRISIPPHQDGTGPTSRLEQRKYEGDNIGGPLRTVDACLDQFFDDAASDSFDSSDDQMERLRLLEEIIRRAHEAHRALEEAVPLLSIRRQHIHLRDRLAEEAETAAGDDTDLNGSKSRLYGATFIETILPRSCRMLDAWALVARRMMTIAPCTTLVVGGIPQRAQHLLDQMEEQVAANTEAALTAAQRQGRGFGAAGGGRTKNAASMHRQPQALLPITAYHRIMECWACSQEHLRATMAERVFQRLHGGISTRNPRRFRLANSDSDETLALLESHRIMIRAWANSTRDPRAAFTATGHLMRMHKVATSAQLLKARRADLENEGNSAPAREFSNQGEEGDEEGGYTELGAISLGGLEGQGQVPGPFPFSGPTLDDYRAVMEAWTRAQDKMAPHKAWSVIKFMDDAYANGQITVRPDLICYRSVLVAAARRPALPDLGPLVDSVFSEMAQHLIVPDTECFRAGIETYRNAAVLYSGRCALPLRSAAVRKTSSICTASSSPFSAAVAPPDREMRDRSAARALELLEYAEVARQQQQTGGIPLAVSTQSVNHVMEAVSVSQHPRRVEICEALLSRLEHGLDSNHQDSALPVPDFESYRLVMEVWKSSPSSNGGETDSKLSGAESVLDRMKSNSALLVRRLCSAEQSATTLPPPSRRQLRRQIVAVFNAFAGVCSSVAPQSEEHGLAVFRQALAGLQGLRHLRIAAPDNARARPPAESTEPCRLFLTPNAESYAGLLEACSRLVPPGKDRQRWVGQVFRLACQDGMVDEKVLGQLKVAAVDDHYNRLVVEESETVEGTKVVPESWTRNALGGRVVTAEGRRTTPLSVGGQLTVTLAMREFQMRRLRDHRNRKLLQGGRILPLDSGGQ